MRTYHWLVMWYWRILWAATWSYAIEQMRRMNGGRSEWRDTLRAAWGILFDRQYRDAVHDLCRQVTAMKGVRELEPEDEQ